MRPRIAVFSFLASIVTTGLATCLIIALVLLRFLSGSLLALMGDACDGIFEYSHGFLAASRWNYLLAVLLGAVLLAQLAFLLAGGSRLFRSTHRRKQKSSRKKLFCPAFAAISGRSWARRIYYLRGDERIDAHTVGLLKPRIVLYEGLVKSLDGDQLMAVVAHEEAHRSRRDNLITAVARTFSLALFYLPGPRVALREMRAAMERDADDSAARQTGSPLAVAEALAKIAVITSASRRSDATLAMTLSGDNNSGALTERVQYMLRDEQPCSRRRLGGRILLFSVGLLAACSVFAGSALAVVGSDQRDAFICFTQHEETQDPADTCGLDHSQGSVLAPTGQASSQTGVASQ